MIDSNQSMIDTHLMQKVDILALDGRQMQLLLSIYETGSVSAAAAAFDLNQSTVSHHLDRVRRIIGDPLFVKVGRSIAPTDHMSSIVPGLRAAVAAIEGLSLQRVFDPATETETLTVATNVSELLPALLRLRAAVASHAPRARLRLIELGSRDRIEPLLESARADIVITVRARGYPVAVNTTTYSEDHQAIFYDPSVRGPVTSLDDYCDARHAVLDFGGTGQSTIDLALERTGRKRVIALGVPDAFSLGEFLRGTDMIATMQSSLGLSVLQGLATCKPPFDLPRVNHDLVWHKRTDSSPRNVWLRNLALVCATDTSRMMPVQTAR